MTREPTPQEVEEEQWRAERKAAAAEHAKTPWKVVGDIMRFDRVDGPGRYTLINQEQMLIEILHAMGNAGAWDDPPPMTVSYAPGETEEERQRIIASLRKNKALAADDYPARPGHHSVSLWDREYKYDEAHDTYMWDNNITVTFMFKTDPDVDFWNGQ